MPAPHHSVFTGRMPFLPHNQQRQSTEGIFELVLSLNHNCCLTVVAHWPTAYSNFLAILNSELLSADLGKYFACSFGKPSKWKRYPWENITRHVHVTVLHIAPSSPHVATR